MRRLMLFLFMSAVVLMSIGLAGAAYRNGRLSMLARSDWRERLAGHSPSTGEVTS